MRKYVRTVESLELDGGWLCLDFINTIRHRFETPQHDYLYDYAQLLTWFIRNNLVSREEAARLREVSDTGGAGAAHRAGIEVRETLYQLFRSIVHQKPPDAGVLGRFNEQLRKAHGSLTVVVNAHQDVREEWLPDSAPLQYPLHPIVKSAYDLLRSDWKARVKECPACGWLFLDQSKNGSRRWCNMQTCGSTAKSRRYYHKNKEGLS